MLLQVHVSQCGTFYESDGTVIFDIETLGEFRQQFEGKEGRTIENISSSPLLVLNATVKQRAEMQRFVVLLVIRNQE